MKLIDLNILLYAHNIDSTHHVKARKWLEGVLSENEPVAFPWVVLLGFLRITSNVRVFRSPLTPEQAMSIIDEWLMQPMSKILQPGDEHWRILKALIIDSGTGGNLTTDAHLAAIAIENGCELCSTDNDFARFSKLNWTNPLS